jgi:hypothetical protein
MRKRKENETTGCTDWTSYKTFTQVFLDMSQIFFSHIVHGLIQLVTIHWVLEMRNG